MREYTEAQLQAYVEAHLERDLHQWCGDIPGDEFTHVELLGSQVPCASGVIDILATVNHVPLIIELKAVTASERVVGQVVRYKRAVAETFFCLCLDVEMSTCICGSEIDRHDYKYDEVRVIVIAPDFDKACLHGMSHVGRSLIAQLDDSGLFHIFHRPNTGRMKNYGMDSPHVRDLLCPTAFRRAGANLGRMWNSNYEAARNKLENPYYHYHLVERGA